MHFLISSQSKYNWAKLCSTVFKEEYKVEVMERIEKGYCSQSFCYASSLCSLSSILTMMVMVMMMPRICILSLVMVMMMPGILGSIFNLVMVMMMPGILG